MVYAYKPIGKFNSTTCNLQVSSSLGSSVSFVPPCSNRIPLPVADGSHDKTDTKYHTDDDTGDLAIGKTATWKCRVARRVGRDIVRASLYSNVIRIGGTVHKLPKMSIIQISDFVYLTSRTCIAAKAGRLAL